MENVGESDTEAIETFFSGKMFSEKALDRGGGFPEKLSTVVERRNRPPKQCFPRAPEKLSAALLTI